MTLTPVLAGTANSETLNGKDSGKNVIDEIYGLGGDDVINGSSRHELLNGGDGDDRIYGNGGNDFLYGEAGNDILDGGAGNDILDGGSGNNRLSGGSGNDIYIVRSAGDQVVEDASNGNDTVKSAVSYTLGANVENLTLAGADAISGTGNALNNILVGNAGSNALSGGDGADALSGGAGDDVLRGGSGIDLLLGDDGNDKLYGDADSDVIFGGAGDDMLDGGSGRDGMHGGVGNDDYFVDVSNDIVFELEGEGYDTVQSMASFTLGSNLESLRLVGTADHNGTGNSLNNNIYGNGGANLIDGGAGEDRIIGMGGADHLKGGGGSDTFLYFYPSDSATGAADVISDFTVTGAEADKLDFTVLQNEVMSPLRWSDTTARQYGVWQGVENGVRMVYIDTDGDALHEADMQIALQGVSGALSIDNFVDLRVAPPTPAPSDQEFYSDSEYRYAFSSAEFGSTPDIDAAIYPW